MGKYINRYISVSVVVALILVMVLQSVAFAETPSNIQIQVVPSSNIDIVLSLGQTSVNAENFEADVKRELRNRGVDISKVKVQSVEATETSVFEGKFTMNLYWNNSRGTADVDTYLTFMNGAYEDISLYYGNRQGVYGSSIDIDDTVGNTGEWTTVDFDGVPSHINKLKFRADLYSGTSAYTTFSLIREVAGVRETLIYDTKLVSGKQPNFTEFGELVRNGDVWDFRYTDGTVHPGSVVKIEAKEFTEVLRQPEWRSNSKKILVNMEETFVSDFNNPSALGEILPRLSNEDIHFIAYGNNNNKTQQENIIRMNNGNGAFYPINNYSKAVADTAQYIRDLIDSQNTDSKNVLVGEPVDLSVNPSNLMTNTQTSEYPLGRWKIDHDYNYFDNNIGQASWANQFQKDLLMVFDKPGRYEVFFEDKNPEPRYIYAHRRPVANYSLNINKVGNNFNVGVVDYSYDPDREFSADKGIKATEWKWRAVSSNTWNSGMIPSVLPLGNDYIIQLRVKDEYDVWSFAEQRYITTNSVVSKPIANFSLSPNPVSKYENLTYANTSYDPSGRIINNMLWTVKKDGSVIYQSSTPKLNFSDVGEGSYTISLKVMNDVNLWSEEFTRPLQVTKDVDAPEAIINPTTKDWTETAYSVTAQFSDSGMSGFDKQRYSLTNSYTFPNSGFSEWSTSTSRVVNINTDGEYYLHLEALDKEGNRMTRTSGPYKLDKTAPNSPVINLSTTDWAASGVTFNITGIGDAPNGSGVDKTEYKIDNGSWVKYNSTVTIPDNLKGLVNIYARTIDNVGNISPISNVVAKIDDIPPTITSVKVVNELNSSKLVVDAYDRESGLNDTAYRYYQKVVGSDSDFKIINGGWVSQKEIDLPDYPSSTKYIYKVEVRDVNKNMSVSSDVGYISSPDIAFAGIKEGDFDNTVTVDFGNSVGSDVKVKVFREGAYVALIESGNTFKDEGLDYERDYNYTFIATSNFNGVALESLPTNVKASIGKPTLELSLDSKQYYRTTFSKDFAITGDVVFRKGGKVLLTLYRDGREVSKTSVNVSPYVKTKWEMKGIQADTGNIEYVIKADLEGFENTELYKKEFKVKVEQKDPVIKNK